MPSNVRYLLDSDVLITAKNLHYNPQFCDAFWSWIVDAHKAESVFSIDKVKDELLAGGETDVLYSWAQRPDLAEFFLPSSPGIANWGKLATWAASPTKGFKPAAQAKFLDVNSADAWLIAFAAYAGQYVIVTNEQPAPESKKSIKLPDAAAVLGVKTTTLFDVLRAHSGANFKYAA
jgi:hypothetical protein